MKVLLAAMLLSGMLAGCTSKEQNKKEENIQHLWDSFKKYNICNKNTRKRKRERNSNI